MALEYVWRRTSYHRAGWRDNISDPDDSHRFEYAPQAQVSHQPPADNTGETQTADGSTAMDARVYKAVAKGDIQYLKELSEHRLQAQLTPNHNTILHVAAHFGQTECAKWILALPPCASFPLRPNLKGETPLHLAAREGHLEAVEALIDAAKVLPADVETLSGGRDKEMIRMADKEGDTALHEAVRYGHEDVVSKLLKADPEFVYGANASGGTPLYMAAERGLTGLVKTLIRDPPSPAYTGFMGRTALHAAVTCNDKGNVPPTLYLTFRRVGCNLYLALKKLVFNFSMLLELTKGLKFQWAKSLLNTHIIGSILTSCVNNYSCGYEC